MYRSNADAWPLPFPRPSLESRAHRSPGSNGVHGDRVCDGFTSPAGPHGPRSPRRDRGRASAARRTNRRGVQSFLPAARPRASPRAPPPVIASRIWSRSPIRAAHGLHHRSTPAPRASARSRLPLASLVDDRSSSRPPPRGPVRSSSPRAASTASSNADQHASISFRTPGERSSIDGTSSLSNSRRAPRSRSWHCPRRARPRRARPGTGSEPRTREPPPVPRYVFEQGRER